MLRVASFRLEARFIYHTRRMTKMLVKSGRGKGVKRNNSGGISNFPTIPAKCLSKHSRCQDDIRKRDMPTTRRQCWPVLPPGSTGRMTQQTSIMKLKLDNFLGLHMHPGDTGGETIES